MIFKVKKNEPQINSFAEGPDKETNLCVQFGRLHVLHVIYKLNLDHSHSVEHK